MTASKKTVRTRRGVEPAGRPARREVERGRRARTNSSTRARAAASNPVILITQISRRHVRVDFGRRLGHDERRVRAADLVGPRRLRRLDDQPPPLEHGVLRRREGDLKGRALGAHGRQQALRRLHGERARRVRREVGREGLEVRRERVDQREARLRRGRR